MNSYVILTAAGGKLSQGFSHIGCESETAGQIVMYVFMVSPGTRNDKRKVGICV